MTETIYRASLYLLGAGACIIGAMIFLVGPQQTANMFVSALSLLVLQPMPEGLADANTDSELRFYSVLWIAYGAGIIFAARSIANRLTLSRLMLFVFFAGGVGRLLSSFAAGPPHALFAVLMWLELVLPVLLLGLSSRIRNRPAAELD